MSQPPFSRARETTQRSGLMHSFFTHSLVQLAFANIYPMQDIPPVSARESSKDGVQARGAHSLTSFSKWALVKSPSSSQRDQRLLHHTGERCGSGEGCSRGLTYVMLLELPCFGRQMGHHHGGDGRPREVRGRDKLEGGVGAASTWEGPRGGGAAGCAP